MASDQVGKVGMGGVGTEQEDLAAASRRAGNKEKSAHGEMALGHWDVICYGSRRASQC